MRLAMSNRETATFPARFDSLAAIGEFVTRAAQSAGLDDRAVYAVELAVDEACSNIIEHAYGGECRGEIEIICATTAKGLSITLRDYGCAFEPATVPAPDLSGNLENIAGGGLGLHIIRRLMDEVHFEFTEDAGNTLKMVKYK